MTNDDLNWIESFFQVKNLKSSQSEKFQRDRILDKHI